MIVERGARVTKVWMMVQYYGSLQGDGRGHIQSSSMNDKSLRMKTKTMKKKIKTLTIRIAIIRKKNRKKRSRGRTESASAIGAFIMTVGGEV